MESGEDLFEKRFLSAPLSKNFHIMAPGAVPPLAEPPQGQDIAVFERHTGETFIHMALL